MPDIGVIVVIAIFFVLILSSIVRKKNRGRSGGRRYPRGRSVNRHHDLNHRSSNDYDSSDGGD